MFLKNLQAEINKQSQDENHSNSQMQVKLDEIGLGLMLIKQRTEQKKKQLEEQKLNEFRHKEQQRVLSNYQKQDKTQKTIRKFEDKSGLNLTNPSQYIYDYPQYQDLNQKKLQQDLLQKIKEQEYAQNFEIVTEPAKKNTQDIQKEALRKKFKNQESNKHQLMVELKQILDEQIQYDDAIEIYDDFSKFRTNTLLEYKKDGIDPENIKKRALTEYNRQDYILEQEKVQKYLQQNKKDIQVQNMIPIKDAKIKTQIEQEQDIPTLKNLMPNKIENQMAYQLKLLEDKRKEERDVVEEYKEISALKLGMNRVELQRKQKAIQKIEIDNQLFNREYETRLKLFKNRKFRDYLSEKKYLRKEYDHARGDPSLKQQSLEKLATPKSHAYQLNISRPKVQRPKNDNFLDKKSHESPCSQVQYSLVNFAIQNNRLKSSKSEHTYKLDGNVSSSYELISNKNQQNLTQKMILKKLQEKMKIFNKRKIRTSIKTTNQTMNLQNAHRFDQFVQKYDRIIEDSKIQKINDNLQIDSLKRQIQEDLDQLLCEYQYHDQKPYIFEEMLELKKARRFKNEMILFIIGQLENPEKVAYQCRVLEEYHD